MNTSSSGHQSSVCTGKPGHSCPARQPECCAQSGLGIGKKFMSDEHDHDGKHRGGVSRRDTHNSRGTRPTVTHPKETQRLSQGDGCAHRFISASSTTSGMGKEPKILWVDTRAQCICTDRQRRKRKSLLLSLPHQRSWRTLCQAEKGIQKSPVHRLLLVGDYEKVRAKRPALQESER